MKRIISALLALIMVFAFVGCDESNHTGEARTPSRSLIQKGRDYQEVIADFEEHGFTNIKTEIIYDLTTGWLTDDGEVESVSVNGNEKYSADTWYPKDVEVIISYHTFKTNKPEETEPKGTEGTKSPEETTTPSTEESDHTGEARTPSGSLIQKGRDYKEVIADFEEHGFTNIKTEIIYDLITGWLTDDGEVESVSVDGNENYTADAWYPNNVEVIISYHTFKTNKPEGTDPKETEGTKSPEETTTPSTEKPTEPIIEPVDISTIPAYSNSPYVAINNNTPVFAKSDLTTNSFESYATLDSLGRCGVAYANIGKDIMPTTERGSIGSVKPSGWQTVKYDIVDGKYLYNRCHLIGWQLSAENANTKNLITGTRYLNVDGMLPFENMIADYVKETNNHVLYRVTPIFEGNNLLATGVQMEAMSVEDNGEGICFNVFCYNVQPV